MSSILKTKALINSIKRRSFIPRDQATFTDADFLEMATEEITIGLMQQIIDARGDYLVYSIDVPLIPGQRKYTIPDRAHGTKLREASINDENNPENVIWELAQIDIDDLADARDGSNRNGKRHFYLQDDKVVLDGDIIQSGRVIRMYFYMRPNKLVMEDRAAIIDTISTGIETVGLEEVPVVIYSFSSLPKHFAANIEYDITSKKSPNKIKSFGITPVSINLATRSFSFRQTDIRESAVFGDYLTIAEETIVPNIPTEYHPIVAQRTARACLEAMNDDAGYAKASSKLAEMEKAVMSMIRIRVEGAPKKIKNRGGALRQGTNKKFRKW